LKLPKQQNKQHKKCRPSDRSGDKPHLLVEQNVALPLIHHAQVIAHDQWRGKDGPHGHLHLGLGLR
jgi:hypothetical protein